MGSNHDSGNQKPASCPFRRFRNRQAFEWAACVTLRAQTRSLIWRHGALSHFLRLRQHGRQSVGLPASLVAAMQNLHMRNLLSDGGLASRDRSSLLLYIPDAARGPYVDVCVERIAAPQVDDRCSTSHREVLEVASVSSLRGDVRTRTGRALAYETKRVSLTASPLQGVGFEPTYSSL